MLSWKAIFISPNLYWHIHHDILLEFEREPITERIKFIKYEKPADQIETRLKLLKKVKGKLPFKIRLFATLIQGRHWYRLLHHCNWYDSYTKACIKHKQKIEKLHKKECPDCPWNGFTIFPKK